MSFFHNAEKEQKKRELQEQQYQKILEKFKVPKEHYKVVIGQSKIYNIYNCPAILWLEKDKVKTLIFRINPVVVENELEDYMFISSQPYVDFIRFDGTEYPDWARQSAYIKKLFLPYVEQSITKGGLDYNRQMYWIGTMCVYARSLAECLKMIGRPLSAYEIHVDKKERMKEDGAIPEEMLEEKKKAEGISDAVQSVSEEKADLSRLVLDMETTLQKIRAAEYDRGQNEALVLYSRLVRQLLLEHNIEELQKAAEDAAYLKKLLGL